MSKKNKFNANLNTNTNFTPLSSLTPTPVKQEVEPEPSQTTYKLVVSRDLNTFTESVNALLKQGWLLQGGIDTSAISTPYDVVVVYSQALVKIS